MNSKKSLPLFIFALSAFCCLTTITAQGVPETCEIRFFPGEINNNQYIYYDGDDVAPFTGWAWKDFHQQTDKIQRTYPSLRAVQAGWCEHCSLTVYSTENYGGRTAEYSFRDGFEFEFDFCVKSFDLSCEQVGGGEEEQEEVQILFEFLDENQINTPEVMEIVNTGFTEAVGYMKGDGTLPAGQYQIVNINSVERSTNFDDTYRLTLDISDGQGNDFVAIIMVVDDPSASPYAVYWEAAPK